MIQQGCSWSFVVLEIACPVNNFKETHSCTAKQTLMWWSSNKCKQLTSLRTEPGTFSLEKYEINKSVLLSLATEMSDYFKSDLKGIKFFCPRLK